MHRFLILFTLFCGIAHAAVPACPVTVGTITLNVTVPRASGVSPITIWFDSTGTTDSSITGNFSIFQRGTWLWNFGDTGASSGQGVWQAGAQSGYQSKNIATGGIAAHMYMTSGSNKTYTATVTYTNPSGASATCSVTTGTITDPSNYFTGTNTICVYNSTLGTGCPSGAATVNTSTLETAFAALGTGKQLLFKCGDTFTTTAGNVNPGTIHSFTVDQYGACTGSNRPIFNYSGSTSNNFILLMSIGSIVIYDARLGNFDCENTTFFASQGCVNFSGNNNVIPAYVTMYNLKTAGLRASYYWSHGAQFSLVNSSSANQNTAIGTFVNIDGNGTGTWTGSPVNNIQYQAIIGNTLFGTGDPNTGNGTETIRIGACQMCVFTNNTFKDASTQAAVFKLFESNHPAAGPGGSQIDFAGIPVQYVEISDNLLEGKSGAQLGEISPQNTCFDEHLQDIVVERNLALEQYDNLGSYWLMSGQRITFRDNVMYGGTGFVHPSFYNVQVAGRTFQTGATGNGCPTNPVNTVQPTQYMDFYNNTAYTLSYHSPQEFIAINAQGLGGAPASSSNFSNNLYYSPGGSSTTVDNLGTGNTVSNNTGSASNNPAVKNYSGSFSVISDFKPTANYSGGTTVPVPADALGVNWSPTWDLGAVKH